MSSSLFTFIIANMFVSVLVGGIIFISLGYKFNRKLSLIRAGWIIIGAASIATTILLAYLSIMTGYMLGIMIFLIPLAILVGLIVTMALGISNVAQGFSKPRNKEKITSGFVLIGINLAITTTIIVLLVMFTTGIIPIRLM